METALAYSVVRPSALLLIAFALLCRFLIDLVCLFSRCNLEPSRCLSWSRKNTYLVRDSSLASNAAAWDSPSPTTKASK
jgi:hypothetical protein